MLLLVLGLHWLIVGNSQSHPCSNMGDCSYNGICKDKLCECFPQWKGQHCAALNLTATDKNAGLQSVVNNSRASTWGGGIVYDDDSKLYHMVASEIIDSCGMDVWLSNSQIVHAVSSSPVGKFERTSPILEGLFSHEPNIVKALDTGEIVVYFTHIYPPATYKYPCKSCTNGATNDAQCPSADGSNYGRNWNAPLPTKMIYTSTPNITSSWSEMIDINISPNPFVDSNMAVYIFPNGSLVGLLRTDDDPNYYLTKATNWKDNSTYSVHAAKVPKNCCGEDMFIYYDSRYDALHCIWHWYNATGDHPLGVHTYSIDGGYEWNGYVNFNEYPEEYAYDNVVQYKDGSSIQLSVCERPHLLLDSDGYTPIALTNGVHESDRNDYSYTLLRPINQN